MNKRFVDLTVRLSLRGLRAVKLLRLWLTGGSLVPLASVDTLGLAAVKSLIFGWLAEITFYLSVKGRTFYRGWNVILGV